MTVFDFNQVKKVLSFELQCISGSGLGRLMSLRFASLGSKLVLWDIDEVGNGETAKLVQSAGAEVATYTVDLSKREAIYQTAEKVSYGLNTDVIPLYVWLVSANCMSFLFVL